MVDGSALEEVDGFGVEEEEADGFGVEEEDLSGEMVTVVTWL